MVTALPLLLVFVALGSLFTMTDEPPGSAKHESGQHGSHRGHGDHARVTHGFGDVEKWAEIWDDPERDRWQEPARVIAAMELKPGMTVVDLGAGTGYFNCHLSTAVGADGAVYPVDVEPSLVEYMIERAGREETPNVHPVLGEHADPKIPIEAVDRLLIVNTFHHIDERRAYFARLRDRLTDGGLLINVDWKPGDLDMGPPPEHKLHPTEVAAELEAAGFALRAEHDLEFQYVQVFEVSVAPR